MAAGPVHGVYWLPALDQRGQPSRPGSPPPAMKPCACASSRSTPRCARSTSRSRSPARSSCPATRLGGQHGYDEAGAVAPLGGAVAGFSKAYKRERPDVLVKAVDFEAEQSALEVAERLIGETLRDPGAVEIGYKNGLRWTIGLQEQPASDGQPGLTLDENSCVPDHRRGGQHRLRHHCRSGSRIRRHLLPA